MQAGATTDGAVREWRPPYAIDLAGVLAPLRRGRGDPTWHATDGSAVWRAGTTPDGPATTRLARRGDGTVVMHAWGPGAAWSLDGLPALLGDGDDPSAFVAHHPLVADAHRRMPGIRFCATGRVWDVLVPVGAGAEGHRHRGAPVVARAVLALRRPRARPGVPAGMRVPPTPAQIRAVPDWEWHRAGVDSARRRAILACAAVAHRLENACALGGEAGRELLRRVPGIGVWTAAEVAQRAWGDPDAVSVGDFHIPTAGRLGAAGPPDRRRADAAGARPVHAAAAAGGAVRGVVGVPPAALRPAVLPARLPRDVRRVSAATSQTSSLPRRHDRPCEVYVASARWPARDAPGADVGSAA